MSAEVQEVRQEVFDDLELKVIEQDGEEWFSAEDIGKALEFSEPRKAVLKIYERNKDEFEGLRRVVNLTTWLKTGGKLPYRFTTFNPQGAYLLAILARTPKSKALRRWLAGFMARDLHRLREHLAQLQARSREDQELISRLQGKVGDLTKELNRTRKALPTEPRPKYQLQPGEVVRLNWRDLQKLAHLAMSKDREFAAGLLHQVLGEQTPEGEDYPSPLNKRNLSSLIKGLEAGLKVVNHLTDRL